VAGSIKKSAPGRLRLMVEAALRSRPSSFVVDGEAVLLRADGISDFNELRSRRHNDELQLYAFDILAEDGEDLRKLPCTFARQIARGCWQGGRRGSSSASLSRARSVSAGFQVLLRGAAVNRPTAPALRLNGSSRAVQCLRFLRVARWMIAPFTIFAAHPQRQFKFMGLYDGRPNASTEFSGDSR
jgi:hypothetical protein